VTGYTSRRLLAYATLAAAGLVAGLALGRVEPVALAAPFLLALVAAVAEQQPELSVRMSLDRDRVIEGDEVTATIVVSSARGVDGFELYVPLPPELSGEGGTARAIRLRAGEERTVELKLRCERWGLFSVGRVLFRARDTFGFRSWESAAGEPKPLRVFPREETLRALVPPLETQVFAGNQVSRARGEGIEFADLREWQPGDRLRRGSWRAALVPLAYVGAFLVFYLAARQRPWNLFAFLRGWVLATAGYAEANGLPGAWVDVAAYLVVAALSVGMVAALAWQRWRRGAALPVPQPIPT